MVIKSVQEIPPYNFVEQFSKDLLNDKVDDLSQLKWVFDGKKVTQEQLTEVMRKTIEEWNIPDAVLNKWGKLGYSKNKLKEEILSIFKVD